MEQSSIKKWSANLNTNYIFVFFILFWFTFSISGWGFPYSLEGVQTKGKLQLKSTQSQIDKPAEFYKLQINTQAMKFFQEDQIRYFLGAHLSLKHPIFAVQTSYTYSLYENHHYFRPYQLNLNFKRPDGRWIIGRTLLEWDWADSFWNRGLWQPAYRDDALRPQWAGLTGLFRDFDFSGGKATLFGSFIFLPDFPPAFENKDGKITSDNPWFTSPPSGKVAGSNTVPVYQMKSASWTDFLKLSLAIKAEYKNFYLSYAYKPMNKLKVKGLFSFPLHKELRGSYKDGYLLDIPVETVILQHHLFSGGFTLESLNQDSGQQSTNYRLKTSFTYNHPEEHILDNKSWGFFQPRNEWHISVKGEIHVKDPIEETILHAGYTHQFFPSEEKKNLFQKLFSNNIEKQFFRDDLFEFSRSFSTGINHTIQFEDTQKIKIKARVIYHLLKEYFLFSAYSSWTYQSFSLFLSTDLLFSELPFSIEQTQEDIGIYTNKSRIFGGISYEF